MGAALQGHVKMKLKEMGIDGGSVPQTAAKMHRPQQPRKPERLTKEPVRRLCGTATCVCWGVCASDSSSSSSCVCVCPCSCRWWTLSSGQ